MRLSANGRTAWDKTLGGGEIDQLTCMLTLADGGFLLGGWSWSNNDGDKTEASEGHTDYWLIKLNPDGSKAWDKALGGNNYDYLRSIIQTSDGGYLLGGGSTSDISGDKTAGNTGFDNYWIVKLNADGSKAWDKTFGRAEYNYFASMVATQDGGYLVGGWTTSVLGNEPAEGAKGGIDYWVVKLNHDGSKAWDKVIGGNGDDYLSSLAITADGGFLLAGSSTSGASGDKTEDPVGGFDYWVVKLNANGQKVWEKTVGGSSNDYLTSLAVAPSGGIILSGGSQSGIGGDKTEASRGESDYWIVMLDANGNINWDKALGGSGYDQPHALAVIRDGEYIVGGSSSSGAGGDKTEASRGESDYWVVRLSTNATPPLIMRQPVAQTIIGGQSTNFTVAADGTGLTYQWQVSRDGGITFNNITNGLSYGGATTATLAITKAPVSMNGLRYRVQISNGGVSTSQTAMLSVEAPAFDNTRVWQSIGLVGRTDSTSLALDAAGTPYLAYGNPDRESRATLMKYNGRNWVSVGEAGKTGYVSLAIGANGTPHVAYEHRERNYRATVMKSNGADWEAVGTEGFSGPSGQVSVALDANNLPYVAHTGDKVTVMRYSGTLWELVGTAGLSSEGADYTRIALDAEGTPYVAFRDFANSFKATVMRFTGERWVPVGPPGFSAGEATDLSLAVDANGTPYLAYSDRGNGAKATVMRFNGDRWEPVGTEAFTAEQVRSMSLALDASGTPYLSFMDWTHGTRITVVRFNGIAWTPVGVEGFSTWPANSTSVALDPTGVPYVAYREGGQAVVMKFASNAVPSSISLSSSVLNENVPANTVVGILTTADSDATDTHTYTLVDGEGAADNATFTIDGDQLRIKVSPNYEDKSSYSVRVRTSDGKANGHLEKAFVIHVVDLDEVKPAITLSTPASPHVNAPFIVTFAFSEAVTDFIMGDITVVNGAASEFTAVSATSYRAKITPAAQGQVRVSVSTNVAQDAAGNGNTASSELIRTYDSAAPVGYGVAFVQTVVNYGNERDVSARVTGAEVGASYSYTVTSSGGGTAVTGSGTVAASSFDITGLNLSGLGNGQLTLTLRLTDPAANAGAAATAQVMKHSRNINSYTRPVSVRVPFRTAFSQLVLPSTVEVAYSDDTRGTVQVTWQQGAYNSAVAGSYELSGTLTPAEGTTNLQNITATATVVVEASRAATAISLSRSEVDENNAVGAVIGTLSSTDPDQGDTHTYTLVPGEGATDNASFSIEGDQLKAARAFDFEAQQSLSVRIRTTDSGGASFEATKVITVNDLQDSVTGIAEEENQMLQIFPNPTSRYLMVSFNKVIDAVRLVDSRGATVLMKEGRLIQVQLDIAPLAPGVYVAVIYSQGKVYTKRIVVIR
ncbi:hypothetical protein GCM10027443_43410 [Pontibacter brevis]